MARRAAHRSVWVAVHARHMSYGACDGIGADGVAGGRGACDGSLSAGVLWRGVEAVLRGCRVACACVVLAASDRPAFLSGMEPLARGRNCSWVALPRSMSDGQATGPFSREQGAHTGLTAYQDLYLLSLADHLVGTLGSSFSLLAAALVAARHLASHPALGRANQQERRTRGARERARGRAHGPSPPPLVVDCPTLFGRDASCAPPRPLIYAGVEAPNWWHVSFGRWPELFLYTRNATLSQQADAWAPGVADGRPGRTLRAAWRCDEAARDAPGCLRSTQTIRF